MKNVPDDDHAIKLSVVKLSTVYQKYRVKTHIERAVSVQVSAAYAQAQGPEVVM